MYPVYDKFDKAFSDVSAYAIVKDGRYIGRAVFRHKSACTCFLQIWGADMVSGRATGYGYDKATAAFENALRKLGALDIERETAAADRRAIVDAFNASVDGYDWTRRLRDAGVDTWSIFG